MTLADDIRKDRERRILPGPWRVLNGRYSLQIHSERHWLANIKCETCPAYEESTAERIARVPALEEAYLAALDALEKADELATKVSAMEAAREAFCDAYPYDDEEGEAIALASEKAANEAEQAVRDAATAYRTAREKLE